MAPCREAKDACLVLLDHEITRLKVLRKQFDGSNHLAATGAVDLIQDHGILAYAEGSDLLVDLASGAGELNETPATILGISRPTLLRKIRLYGLNPGDGKQ